MQKKEGLGEGEGEGGVGGGGDFDEKGQKKTGEIASVSVKAGPKINEDGKGRKNCKTN